MLAACVGKALSENIPWNAIYTDIIDWRFKGPEKTKDAWNGFTFLILFRPIEFSIKCDCRDNCTLLVSVYDYN